MFYFAWSLLNFLNRAFKVSHQLQKFIKYFLLIFLLPHFLISSSSVTNFKFVVVQLLSCVRLFATPQSAAYQASLSFTISQSLLKLMSIESVIPSNHLVLCHPLLLPPSIFLSIRDFFLSLHQVTKVLELQLQHQSFQ